MRPNIFEYTNYRKYLADHYTYAKETNKSFSYRYFAAKAGFVSSNFLYLIIKGKRNLTNNFIHKFADALELSKKEQQCFESLVLFNQAETPEAKRYYLELLHALKKEKVGAPIRDEQFEYMSKWYYVVIRELISLPHFEENADWIRKQLGGRITAGDAQEAIEKMLRLGILWRDENGRLVQTDSDLTTEDEIANTAAYSFHRQMLSLANDVLATTAGSKREVSGVTMAVSPKQFAEVKRMIHEFENMIMNYLDHNPDVPDNVFQLNVQFFPVTGKSMNVKNGNGGRK